MTSRLLCVQRVASSSLVRHSSRRALSTTVLARKAGREWDYIDGPAPPSSSSTKSHANKRPSGGEHGAGTSRTSPGTLDKPASAPHASIQSRVSGGKAHQAHLGGTTTFGNHTTTSGSTAHSSTTGRDETARGNSSTPVSPQPPSQSSPTGMDPISPKM
ncbi:hypothetical protein FBU31_006524, partial [Coemansia sp. 'formosensis']